MNRREWSVWLAGPADPGRAAAKRGGGFFTRQEAEGVADRMNLLISMGRLDYALRLRKAHKLEAWRAAQRCLTTFTI